MTDTEHGAPAPAPAPPAPPTRRGRAVAPRLADGVELLGVFADSGFEDPPYLARRGDGQTIQLTHLLHLVAEAADGQRDHAAIAGQVSEGFGRHVTADNVAFLAEKKLRPLGILTAADGSSPRLRKADPLLALAHRTTVVPEERVQGVARVLSVLFAPPVVAVLLVALLAFDGWLLLSHGIGGGLRAALYEPLLLLGLFGAVILATAWHELGHAAACRYGGARPGVLGAGIYLVWPAFFCDVTDAYRLDRRGRLRVDLGGVWFNALFSLAAAGAFLATDFEPLVLVLVTQHLIILQQLLPVLRFDGYYVLSDLTGVPDVLGRVRPILSSVVPGKEAAPAVQELKPWVRRVVTTYVLLMVPLLLGVLLLLVVSLPRMLATAWDSLGLQADRVSEALGDGAIAAMLLGIVQVVALVLPLAAIALTFGRLGRRSATGLVRWGRASRGRGAVALAGTAALTALAVATWWPNGDYAPLRPGEEGTLGDAVQAAAAIPTGRPGFTAEREAELADVPTEREARAPGREDRPERPAGEEPAAPDDRGARERRARERREAAREERRREATPQGPTGDAGAAAPPSETAPPTPTQSSPPPVAAQPAPAPTEPEPAPAESPPATGTTSP